MASARFGQTHETRAPPGPAVSTSPPLSLTHTHLMASRRDFALPVCIRILALSSGATNMRATAPPRLPPTTTHTTAGSCTHTDRGRMIISH
jgi:hypothetical protein